jgi:hypothetical protein
VLLHQAARQRVQPAEGLVEDHQPRLVDQRADQLGSPLHAAGQLARIAVGRVAQPDPGEQVARPLLGLALAQPARARPEGHVLQRGQPGHQRVLLEHEQPLGAGAAHRRPVDHHAALAGRAIAGQQERDRALAAARRADHRGDAALGQLERAVGHDGGVAGPRLDRLEQRAHATLHGISRLPATRSRPLDT